MRCVAGERFLTSGRKLASVVGVIRRGAARIRTGDGGFAIRCLSHLATAPEPLFKGIFFHSSLDRPQV